MQDILAELVELLVLEPVEVNLFLGRNPDEKRPRVFGGQVVAQALMAAAHTVEGRHAHSLHGYFLRGGDMAKPILYEVDRIRDGKSFTTRRVKAIQHGQAIFNMSVSFQREEDGFEHQSTMPDVPAPDELDNMVELRKKSALELPERFRGHFTRPRPIEIRPTSFIDQLRPQKQEPQQQVWFRAVDKLPDDVNLHQAILAYASDMGLLGTGMLPHGVSFMTPKMQSTSLDHAMWFHRPFRFDDWLLYVQDSPSASGARSFNRGEIYNQQGQLVASACQEGLMRLWKD